MTTALLLVHFACTWYLVGLCWLVQRVQYPLMSAVGEEAFTEYEQGHVARITPVVAPPMLLEAASAMALVIAAPALLTSPLFLATGVLLAVIWISTFAVQVPLHTRLSERFDAAAHRRLVRTNWIRTVSWSLRGLLLLPIVFSWIRGTV